MASEPIDNSRVTIVRNVQKSAASTRRFSDLLRERGLDVEIVSTSNVHEGEQAARVALASGRKLIIAAGGDGTVRSLLPAVADDPDATLGVLPLGTGNDLALELGIRNLADAASTVLGARARPWDVAACTYLNSEGDEERSLFCSTAGVGMIARALGMSQSGLGAAMKTLLGNGVWPPLVTASTCVTKAEPCTLRVDDVAATRKLMLLEISKLRTAGGIPLTPDARGDSGMLHAWTVNDPGFWGCTKILYDALSGSMRQLKNTQVEYFSREASQNRFGLVRVTRIAVEGDARMPVHINGDYVGTTPACFELTGQTFRLLAPAEFAGEAVRVFERKARAIPSTFPASASTRAARNA